MRQVDDPSPGLLFGLRQLRHNQQLAGARTCHIPKPFALAHQTFVVSLERSEKLGWLDVADHPMQGVVVGTMHERLARAQQSSRINWNYHRPFEPLGAVDSDELDRIAACV